MKKIFRILKQSLSGNEYDYTQGSLKKAIVLLSIPMILELSLESVFALVDMYFVSHLPNSKNAIATVGLTESVIALIYTIAIGLSTAATAVVSRRVGEKNFEAASHAGLQAILLSFVPIIIFSILGVLFAEQILQMMGANEIVIKEGAIYTKIMLGGSTAIILLFLINGIFRGAGDATMAMRSLWIASILNIILCPIFIFALGLGLKGAAIATTIGRSIGVLYQCYYLLNGKRSIKINFAKITWDNKVIKSLIEIATPATLQFFIQSGSWILLTYLVATTGGTDASAGYQIAIRNVVFFILPAWGLSNAAATLVGQNLGAKNPLRAEQSVLITTKYNIIFMGTIMLLFVFFSNPIIRIFSAEPSVIKYGVQALQIMGAGYIFYGIGMVMIQSLNGAGDTKTPTVLNFICFWLIQIPLGFLLAKYFQLGPMGAFLAIPIAETFLAALAFYFFKKGRWKSVQV
jgi:putative MATE family efflux protein